ncbi:Alpha/Beta hydrolase fold [Moorella glycerini]|uniref:Alpha/beta hydrolase family protein n=1 Tax=Neomoorella stamsii TaxID=1266720 RepID=A0A9X7P5H8_9FIRM|nr:MULTISPECIES: hypothetical protein [Moorella]PRR71306.1 Alpha/beta hydrolase family protein [Moorella stamsii]CEP66653.1 Alpha/Beta hydrolase fold [Moorella glycerini]
MVRIRRRFIGLVVFFLLVNLVTGAVLPPPEARAASHVLISTATDPYPWERVELWGDSSSQMINGQEKIVKFSLPRNDKVRSWFPADIYVHDGYSSTYNDYDFGSYGHLKSNRYFLLGYGPNWQNATKPYPVLLVHGARDDMNRAWAHPWDYQTPGSITNPGLMQYLANRGYAVFAISFPHTHGNNLIQAELIADAIEIIKQKTGASKVDVVAHSKGNLPAIAYMSSLNNEWTDTSWMTDYRGDVRKYIAVAAPFKGLDTMFRYYTANTNVIQNNLNSPVAFWEAYIYYVYRYYKRWDMTDTYNGNYFQGQTQLLHNWVDDPEHPIPFNSESWTSADGNETMYDLYYGGQSAYITSEGINQAIANSNGSNGTSNFIAKLNNKGLDPGINLYVLYGYNQVWDYTWWGYPIGEKADDSDGLLFVASATYTSGVTRRGAPLKAKVGMNYNHLDIVRETPALQWIEQKLAE